MNILVTGSSGFVGTNFVRSNSEHFITEVDLLKQRIEELNFEGVDSVLHLAAIVHQIKGKPKEEYYKVNRDLAFDIAKRAKEQGVRQFILMSTTKVFGKFTNDNLPWDEKAICNPIDSYGKSKFEAEKLISKLRDENYKVAIIRSPLVYGAGVKANMFNLIKLIDKYSILPFGGIDNKRSMVFVGNLIALIKQIINNQASGIFIAGDISPISTTQLINLIAKKLQKKIYLVKVPGIVIKAFKKIYPSIVDRLFGSLELDIDSTNQMLHFTPPFTTEQGINEMIEWYLKFKVKR